MIRDFNGSLGTRQFPSVSNEKTCFASCACAYKSSRLITLLEIIIRLICPNNYSKQPEGVHYERLRRK